MAAILSREDELIGLPVYLLTVDFWVMLKSCYNISKQRKIRFNSWKGLFLEE